MKKMNMSAWMELFSNKKYSDKNEVSGVNHSSGDNRRPKICFITNSACLTSLLDRLCLVKK